MLKVIAGTIAYDVFSNTEICVNVVTIRERRLNSRLYITQVKSL